MMKNTQKKLKAKHFRYLSKENIENPMDYLVDFYRKEIFFDWWLADINAVINASVNAKMRGAPPTYLGYSMKQLIRQVEAAYVIYKKYNIQKQEAPLNFFHTIKDYWNYRDGRAVTKNNKEIPYDGISRFFSYQNLKEWYSILDRLWMNMTDRGEEIDEFEVIGEDKIVAVKELLIRLATSLHNLLKIGEFPEYEIDTPQKKDSDIADNTALKKTELSTPTYVKEISLTNELENSSKTNINEEKSHQLNTNKSTVLEKLRECFLETSLDTWHTILHDLQKGITTDYNDWNEAFGESNPSTIRHHLMVIIELVKLVEVDLSTNFTLDKIDYPYTYNISNLNEFTHYGKIISFRHISQAEISNPEYYLHILSEALIYENWMFQLNEVIQVYLSLEACGYENDNQYIPHFLVQLQKFIELSYLIAFKDEIEFINSPVPEP